MSRNDPIDLTRSDPPDDSDGLTSADREFVENMRTVNGHLFIYRQTPFFIDTKPSPWAPQALSKIPTATRPDSRNPRKRRHEESISSLDALPLGASPEPTTPPRSSSPEFELGSRPYTPPPENDWLPLHCSTCNAHGHTSATCIHGYRLFLPADLSTIKKVPTVADLDIPISCYRCHSIQHLGDDCPLDPQPVKGIRSAEYVNHFLETKMEEPNLEGPILREEDVWSGPEKVEKRGRGRKGKGKGKGKGRGGRNRNGPMDRNEGRNQGGKNHHGPKNHGPGRHGRPRAV